MRPALSQVTDERYTPGIHKFDFREDKVQDSTLSEDLLASVPRFSHPRAGNAAFQAQHDV